MAIPARDMESTIGTLVLKARLIGATVLVVDHGSMDATPAVARLAGARVFEVGEAEGAGVRSVAQYVLSGDYDALVLLGPNAEEDLSRVPRLLEPVLGRNGDGVDVAHSGEATSGTTWPGGPMILTRAALARLGRAAFPSLDRLAALGLRVEQVGPVRVPRAGRHPLLAERVEEIRSPQGATPSRTYRGRRVAVVVPAYNEEMLLPEVLGTIPDFVDRVIVVDDGSTDRTWQVLAACPDPRLVAIRHNRNRGVGGALKTGYLAALDEGVDLVAVMAGDAQMDPSLLPRFLDPLVDGVTDYTKGNRLLSPSYRKGMSRFRFVGNSILTFLTKISSGYWKTMDPQNGYTAITREALERVEIEKMYEYYGYCNDVLMRLNLKNARVADVAMPAKYGREKSKIKYSRYIVRVSSLLVRNFFARLFNKYLLLDFHPLALFYIMGLLMVPLGLLGFGYSVYAKIWLDIPLFVPATASMLVTMFGAMLFAFGMLFDMQDNRDREVRVVD